MQTWNFACLSVWQKLEEENREFFRAYYLRLMVKNQINEFNRLLEQQVQLMRQIHPTGVASMATSNGSHISTRKTIVNDSPYFVDVYFFSVGVLTVW